MKIAASTSTTRELPLLDAVPLVASLGYDALEVWVEHLWDQGVAPDALRRAAGACGLTLSLHGPQRDLNITSTNAGIRAESQRQYLAALDAAAAMRAEVVVLHPGAMSSSGDNAAAFWPPLEACFGALAERAAGLGVRIGIENMERRRLEFVTTPELVVAMLRRIGHPALGLTLDLAHLFYNGDPLHLDGLGPRLVHVHVSGSTHEKVHVPLAHGIYPVAPALNVLSQTFRGVAVVEGFVRGRARETLAENRRIIAGWLRAGGPDG